MAKTKEQKVAIVSKLEGAMKEAQTSVFVKFTQVNVADESKMRKALRAEGLGYTVAKKTLVRRALSALGHDHASMPLEGELAIAYNTASDDPTAAARKVHAFAGEFGGAKLSIVGGIFEGKLVDAASMQEIATIPSLDALRGKLVNLISSPLTRLAVVMDQYSQKSA